MKFQETTEKELQQIKQQIQQLTKKLEDITVSLATKTETTKEHQTQHEIFSGDLTELIVPLANIERIKILKELSENGKYFTELMKETNLSHSPLTFHLNILERAGYIKQEFTRGRYIITPLGKTALQMLIQLYTEAKKERGK
jgi:DNA-binding HxlR family transcriptional regulator